MRNLIATTLRWIGNAYLTLAAALILIGHLSLWYFHGFATMAEALSPFNVGNFILTMLVLSPGLLLRGIAEKLKEAA
jgi:hypothetical protein